MESFILLPAFPIPPMPKILFCWKINHQKVRLHNTHDFFPTQEVQELYPDLVYKEGKSRIQSPTSHTHTPFCSIKIEMAEAASSSQSMNWCENISRMCKKKTHNSFRRYVSQRRLRPWINKHTTWLFHMFSTWEFSWLRKSQWQYPPWKHLKNGILKITPKNQDSKSQETRQKKQVLTFQMCWYLILTSFGSLKFWVKIFDAFPKSIFKKRRKAGTNPLKIWQIKMCREK